MGGEAACGEGRGRQEQNPRKGSLRLQTWLCKCCCVSSSLRPARSPYWCSARFVWGREEPAVWRGSGGLSACKADRSGLHLQLGSGATVAQTSREDILLSSFLFLSHHVYLLICLVLPVTQKSSKQLLLLVFFPSFLLLSCLLLLSFLLLKQAHLSTEVTISTSKHFLLTSLTSNPAVCDGELRHLKMLHSCNNIGKSREYSTEWKYEVVEWLIWYHLHLI